MTNFPIPVKEANRLEKVRKLNLMNLPLPCERLELYLDEYLSNVPKQFELVGLITQIVELDDMKPIAFRLKVRDKTFGKGKNLILFFLNNYPILW